ncbi:MAG: hypothetical protein RLZZ253_2530 [Verrucomicrobiota bacterium]
MHITISRCIRHHGRNGAGRLQATGLDPSGIPGWGFGRLSGRSRGGSWTCRGGMGQGSARDPRGRCRERRGPLGIGAGSQRRCREIRGRLGDRRWIPGLQQPRVQILLAVGQGQRAGGAGSADRLRSSGLSLLGDIERSPPLPGGCLFLGRNLGGGLDGCGSEDAYGGTQFAAHDGQTLACGIPEQTVRDPF